VIAKLHRLVDQPPEPREARASGAVPAPMSSTEFAAMLAGELARWGRVVHEKNIKEE
jgi:hypothetical protein